MAAGKGFWGKLGTSMKNVTPEQWRAGAIITDKLSGGATGYLGTELAEHGKSLDGKFRKKPKQKHKVNDTNNNFVDS
tara:strand:- start:83 stop:313 length:231 start_codon:yes stop_codon:yes gene_type:complete